MEEKLTLLSYAIVYLDKNLQERYEKDWLKLRIRIKELKAEGKVTDSDIKRAIKFIAEQKR